MNDKSNVKVDVSSFSADQLFDTLILSAPLSCVTQVCVCVSRQLYAPVDQISSNVMMETVSWAADSVTASETAVMDQTKSTAKTVCAVCVCVYSFRNDSLIILRALSNEKALFICFLAFVCVTVFTFHLRLS